MLKTCKYVTKKRVCTTGLQRAREYSSWFKAQKFFNEERLAKIMLYEEVMK